MHMRTIYSIIITLVLSISCASPLLAQSVEEKLALQFFQKQEFDKAAPLYKQLYTNQEKPSYYKSYLSCLYAMKKLNMAEDFVKGVKKKNNNALVYDVELAYILKQKKESKKAAKLNKKTLKKVGDSRDQIIEVVNAFYNKGMLNNAIACMDKGKKLFNNPPMNMEMAQLYAQMGKYQEMIGEYLELIEKEDTYLKLVQGKLQLYIANDDSPEMHRAIKNALLKKIDEHPSSTVYSELLYWYSIQKKDFKIALIQSKSLDRKFKEGGERVFGLANTLISNHEYALAEDALQHILSYGENNRFYQATTIKILNVRFKKITKSGIFKDSEVKQLATDYKKLLDKYNYGPTTASMISNLAYLNAFYLEQEDEAIRLLKVLVNMARLKKYEKAEAKMLLGDVMLFKGQKWEASLLYKQVEKDFKHEPIGAEAKFKAARFFYYVGEMEWAKVQLDVLKASTTKLIANDAMDLALLIQENIDPDSTYESLSRYALAELLIYQKQHSKALAVLDTILNIFPGYPILDEALFQKARIYHQLGDLKTADSLYLQVYNSGGDGILSDNAVIESARIQDYHFKDKAKAKDLYKIIIMEFPGSLFLQEARKRFREME